MSEPSVDPGALSVQASTTDGYTVEVIESMVDLNPDEPGMSSLTTITIEAENEGAATATIVQLDADNDGVAEFTAIDTDADGVADVIIADADGDGTMDVLVFEAEAADSAEGAITAGDDGLTGPPGGDDGTFVTHGDYAAYADGQGATQTESSDGMDLTD